MTKQASLSGLFFSLFTHLVTTRFKQDPEKSQQTSSNQHKMNANHLIKTALVVEGGAMRSVFSAGLLDGFLAENFDPFDFYIGVSGGALNLLTYQCRSPGTSFEIFCDMASQKSCISYSRFLLGGHMFDLDWLSRHIAEKMKLELNVSQNLTKPLYVCVTEVESGQALYIKTDTNNYQSAIKASSALPLLYRTFPRIENVAATDGGIADGIPVAQAVRLGATRIMVIRSRHRNYIKKDTLGHGILRWKLRRYQSLTQTMRQRIKIYDETLSLINKPPAGVNIIEVCPPQHMKLGRFSRHHGKLLEAYRTGFEMKEQIINKWLTT